MTDDDLIDAWARSRQEADVSDGFADRVADHLRPRPILRLLEGAAVAFALTLGGLRVAAVLLVLVTPPVATP